MQQKGVRNLQMLAHKADTREKPACFIWQGPESVFIEASGHQGGRHPAALILTY